MEFDEGDGWWGSMDWSKRKRRQGMVSQIIHESFVRWTRGKRGRVLILEFGGSGVASQCLRESLVWGLRVGGSAGRGGWLGVWGWEILRGVRRDSGKFQEVSGLKRPTMEVMSRSEAVRIPQCRRVTSEREHRWEDRDQRENILTQKPKGERERERSITEGTKGQRRWHGRRFKASERCKEEEEGESSLKPEARILNHNLITRRRRFT